jgi:hypothetical protein
VAPSRFDRRQMVDKRFRTMLCATTPVASWRRTGILAMLGPPTPGSTNCPRSAPLEAGDIAEAISQNSDHGFILDETETDTVDLEDLAEVESMSAGSAGGLITEEVVELERTIPALYRQGRCPPVADAAAQRPVRRAEPVDDPLSANTMDGCVPEFRPFGSYGCATATKTHPSCRRIRPDRSRSRLAEVGEAG